MKELIWLLFEVFFIISGRKTNVQQDYLSKKELIWLLFEVFFIISGRKTNTLVINIFCTLFIK